MCSQRGLEIIKPQFPVNQELVAEIRVKVNPISETTSFISDTRAQRSLQRNPTLV